MSKLLSLRIAATLIILSLGAPLPAQHRRGEEQSAKPKSEWTFPAPGMKGQYSEELKTTIYNLGHGFHAARVTLEGHVLVFVSLPEGSDRLEESDLALVIASKTLLLPRRGSDTMLEKEDAFEHRFRTVNGRVAGVTIAHDRKSAVVRLVPIKGDGFEY